MLALQALWWHMWSGFCQGSCLAIQSSVSPWEWSLRNHLPAVCWNARPRRNKSVERGPHCLHGVGRVSYTRHLGNHGKTREIPASRHQPKRQQSSPRKVASCCVSSFPHTSLGARYERHRFSSWQKQYVCLIREYIKCNSSAFSI